MTDEQISWLRDKSSELQDSNDDKKPTLVEMKSGLGALDRLSLQKLASSVDLNLWFQVLKSNDSAEVEMATDVIILLLNSLTDEELLSRYSVLIQQALEHNSGYVKRAFLKILQNQVTVQSIIFISTQHPGILTQVIECLAYQDRGISEGAVLFFKKIGRTLDGVQILFTCGFVEVLKRIMALSDIARFRVYEIVVDISVHSNEGLQAGHECGILPALLNELKSEDALIQLNALELLTNLTTSSMGLLYLQREGVIKFLVDRIINIKDDPLSFILLPGLIEFFGNLYKLQPTVFSQQHPEILQLLFDSFVTVDPALLGVAISTVGKIGFSDEGKSVLIGQRERTNAFFGKVGKILLRKDDLCVTAMNTLAALFTTANSEISAAIKEWFDAIGPMTMETIVSHCKLPFIELRLSALEFLEKIALHEWGVGIICKHPGLMEFLLDRNVEFDKNCKHAKYDILAALSANPIISTNVPSDVLIRIKQFLKEGPYYVVTEPEMTFEGA